MQSKGFQKWRAWRDYSARPGPRLSGASITAFRGTVLTHHKPLNQSAPLTYGKAMIFIETPTFTKQVKALLDDDEYSALQRHLAQDPDCGALIENTGGLRKVR